LTRKDGAAKYDFLKITKLEFSRIENSEKDILENRRFVDKFS